MNVKSFFITLAIISIIGCTGIPKGIRPVQNFDVERYEGKWYEIARLDHSFERNLSNVSATYTIDESGDIRVVNRGYKASSGEWKTIEGVARFAGDETIGRLEVSFFGPFYGGYNIVDLDQDHYTYAMVVGPSRSYFWILSRDKTMDEALLGQLLDRAAANGIDTKKLIRVEQNLPEG